MPIDMDIDLNLIAQKLRGTLSFPIGAFPIMLIKDPETGQINWSNIITSSLAAGVIAVGSSLISISNKLSELSIIVAQRSTYVEQLPVIATRQQNVIERLEKIEGGNVAATNDRFRRGDAERMEAGIERRITSEIARLERRIDNIQQGGSRK